MTAVGHERRTAPTPHVESFVDTNRDERVKTITDVKGHTYRATLRRRRVDEPMSLSAQSVLQLGSGRRIPDGQSSAARSQAARVRARTAARARRGRTAPRSDEG